MQIFGKIEIRKTPAPMPAGMRKRRMKAPAIVKVVNLARKHARPHVSHGYLPRGVTPVTELAEMFLRDYNAWNKGRAWFDQDRSNLYPRLTETARKVAEQAAGSADPCEVAGEQACYHACVAISHAHKALQLLVTDQSPNEEFAQAVEELVLVHFHNMERMKAPLPMEVARNHIFKWLGEPAYDE